MAGTSAFLINCSQSNRKVSIDYEKYTLSNGLNVVFQPDHSDPIVAVAIQYHVGSAREQPGKTGFAHFFEHMLFQRSENLPRNAFFEKISGILLGTFTYMEKEKCRPQIIDLVRKYAGNEIAIAYTSEIGHGTNSKGIIIGEEISKKGAGYRK